MAAKDRHRLSIAAREALTRTLSAMLPDLDLSSASRMLRQSGAWHMQALFDLQDHLRAHPDALTSGASACPLSLVRLAHALVAAGHTDVVAPRCVRCGRSAPRLPAVREAGRICLSCYRLETRTHCVRCGRATKACYRRDEGLICASCRDREPATRGRCPSCGRDRPLRRGRDGTTRCDTCAPRPVHTCVDCGQDGPADAITDDGPICDRCYRSRSARPCGRCQQVRPIALRATADHPDLCGSCRPRTTGICSVCDRHTYGSHTDRGHGPFRCEACRPRILRECARCRQSRPSQALWPMGSVCRSCYLQILHSPGPCSGCGRTRALIGEDDRHRGICGSCAGSPLDFCCRRCGQGNRLHHHGLCQPCTLTDLLAELRTANPALRPLTEVIGRAEHPGGMIRWLTATPTGALLNQLAADNRTLTHQHLDRLPQTNALHHVRHVLVRTGVLPERQEYLDRILPWLTDLLRDAPEIHAAIVGPYARWFLLHRARRRAARRGLSAAASYSLRSDVRRSLQLLAWLQQHDTTLAQATQADVDTWLTEGSPERHRIRMFLSWAHEHGHAAPFTVTAIPVPDLSPRPAAPDTVSEQLRRCLHDQTLPLTVRVAGALVLLFGIRPAKLVTLTTDNVSTQTGTTRLTIGRAPIDLPPALAALVSELADLPPDPSPISRATGQTRYLFPGKAAGRPIRTDKLHRRLRRYGVDTEPGRHAALIALTEDLPTPIIADLLGLKVDTANRWAVALSKDWMPYLGARARDTAP